MGSSTYSTELLRAYLEENNQDAEEQDAGKEPQAVLPGLQALNPDSAEDSEPSNEDSIVKADSQFPVKK